jgi:general secretion pathway protein K
MVSLLGLMAGSFSLATHREIQSIHQSLEKIRLDGLCEGAVHLAALMLSQSNQQSRWIADGRRYDWAVGNDVQVRIEAFDESGKVDLNSATDETLFWILHTALGGDDTTALRLADALQDWKDSDDLKRPNGAEESDYVSMGMKSLPQNRSFQSLEEIGGVVGVTNEILRKITPWFTLYTNQESINPNKATREVLLGISGGDHALVEKFILQREQGGTMSFPPSRHLVYNTSNGDDAYTIKATALYMNSDIRSEILTIIKRAHGGNPSLGPYQIVSWIKG